MKKQNNPAPEKSILRQKAEEMMKKRPLETVTPLSQANSLKLIHELVVHQIELEMQNDELQQARTAAQLAADKYLEIYDFAPSGYFTLSNAGKIIELNLSGSKMLGSDRSLLKNSTFGFFVSRDTRLIFNQFLKYVFTGKAKETCEVTLSIPDHSPVYVQLIGTMAENADQCFITAIDITERKRADEALLNERSLFRTIIDLIPDAVFAKDLEGRKILANPKEVQLSGKNSEDEIIGKTDFDLFPEIEAKRALAEDQLVLQTGNPLLNIEGKLIDSEGKLHHLLGSKVVIRDRLGKITGLAGLTRDITERKRAEELLQLSEVRYRSIVDNLGEGIGFVNTKEQFEFTNRAAEDIFGVEPGKLVGMNLNQFVSHEQYSRIQKETAIRVRGEKSNYELEIIRPNGGKRTIVVTAVAQIDKEGKFTGTYGFFRDITESKQAECELKYALSLNDATLESIHNGILVVSDQGTVIKTNAKFAEMWRIPSDILASVDDKKLMDNILGQLVYPDGFVAAIMELYAKPEADSFDLIYFKDGRIFERISKPMFFEGKPKARVWSFLDITERKQVEEDLAREQYLMQMLMDQLPDHIYFKDLKSRFVRINKSHARLFGLDDPDQAIGKTDSDFFSGEHSQQAFDDELLIIRTGQPLSIEEKETYTDDRSDSWVSTVKMPLFDKNGKIIGTFGISRDITKQQAAKEEIRLKNDELQKLNSEKDKFFSLIAHDLRNPFSSFMGITEMMVEELDNMSLKEIQLMADQMKKSAFNLYTLLENLLEWSRMERGLSSFDPKLFLLKPKITESMHAVSETAGKKGIQVIDQIPEDLEVMSDENMLKSTLRNLATNAVKFTPKGGEVIINARLADNGFVEISVKDSGIGMKKEMIDKLFLLDGKTSRRGTDGEPSTGLGLLLCKEFVEKHGGKIWVESEEGKGSTFFFTIPTGDKTKAKFFAEN